MSEKSQVVLVTGAARRLGAAIVRVLHAAGMNVAVHCHRSTADAGRLAADLNAVRANSAIVVNADLLDTQALAGLVRDAAGRWGRLDGLVNNASTFYPTPLGKIDEAAWTDLTGTNLKAPLLLSEAAAPLLRQSRGAIVNLLDIHVGHPLPEHAVYTTAKGGLLALTRALARDLAPEVRVNAVAPGTILWPEHENTSDDEKAAIIRAIPLQRIGTPADVAEAVRFLLSRDAAYITGEAIRVDGGRGIGWV